MHKRNPFNKQKTLRKRNKVASNFDRRLGIFF